MKLNQTEPPNIKRIGDSAGHPDFLWRQTRRLDIFSGPLSPRRFDPLSNLTK
jgi:hypothetical protein